MYVCLLDRTLRCQWLSQSVCLSAAYPHTSSQPKLHHFNFMRHNPNCFVFHLFTVSQHLCLLPCRDSTQSSISNQITFFLISLIHMQHNISKLCNCNITPVHHSEHTDTTITNTPFAYYHAFTTH
jgi:hypothetical protein